VIWWVIYDDQMYHLPSFQSTDRLYIANKVLELVRKLEHILRKLRWPWFDVE